MGAINASNYLALTGVSVYPELRGRSQPANAEWVSRLSLPDDPSGTTTVAFEGIVAGSEIHVYLPDGTEVAGTESCSANQELTWPVYAGGSPNNTVTITLIKRGLRWQKFPYQSKAGSWSIPIFQNPDLGYSNPA